MALAAATYLAFGSFPAAVVALVFAVSFVMQGIAAASGISWERTVLFGAVSLASAILAGATLALLLSVAASAGLSGGYLLRYLG